MNNSPTLEMNRRHFLLAVTAAGLTSAIGDAESASSSEKFRASSEESETTLQKLAPVAIEQVQIDDEFWSPKRKVWQETTIRDCFTKFENYKTGTFNNFDRVRAGEHGNHAGDPWWDGLVYEMIRGSADFLRSHPDAALEHQIDGYIERITAAAAINPHGYINTYTALVEPGHEWGLNGGFQLWQHEIYNLGALIDAGVHYYRATGKTPLLAAGVKIANYMYEFMGPAPKKNLVPCHPLPEEALVRLYELFQEKPALKEKIGLPVQEADYLHLAEFWIENRGNNIGKPDWKNQKASEQFVRNQEYGTGRPSWGPYAQDDASVFEQKDIHGHAVRATLLCTGIAAAARVNGDERYRETAVRLWENMVYRRMHLTGGVGAYAQEEKFGPDYALPNNAYNETCAAVGAGFFHHNMNMAFGHARYVDELERVLYNGALAGVSLKGDRYFYENPLEANTSRERWSWHDCPCCPPMFLKMMGALPSYIYATDDKSAYVNLFIGSKATMEVNGAKVSIRQTTRYPWHGSVRITVDPEQAASFAVMLRIPAWCTGESVKVNGQSVPTQQKTRGYVRIDRTWNRNDVVELEMPMPIRQVFANPLIEANVGRSALMRGPVVYCVESVDNSNRVAQLLLTNPAAVTAKFDKTLLDGVVVITAQGAAAHPTVDVLYSTSRQLDSKTTAAITAIPYYANANRGPVDMAVWLRLTS
ncbi:MAG TPA: beta-L-arabinofuranosidase domain-containing protein [Terracidiphilus sp.]|nr:beta-L-arabinofuranosidase domain-containing protein [Terracidiphilus sp.]